MTIYGIAHFIGASKYSVSRPPKSWQQTLICVTTAGQNCQTTPQTYKLLIRKSVVCQIKQARTYQEIEQVVV